MPINAIGLLNRSVSDSWLRDERAIIDLSHARGYRLAHTVTIDADTYMPTTLIVWTAHQHSATVVVTPSVEHFPSTGIQNAVTLACALVTPTCTIPALETPTL
ncbi:hypothetical protein APR12_002175 [Nocardia amikacinitolerans]|uniref:hypothetical protein n=1 Tax=Nocardia amikacinitolerans TaxID=756689 RepID=UPI000AFB23C6|nr:hypothetical protein [Nocardia amikacinitolerans]MCP2316835.1 hypothetical protein [Nocardia amikacinitolerans]